MSKCDLNKVAKQLYWNHNSAWVLACKFAAYFQTTFFQEHFWRAASVTVPHFSLQTLLVSDLGTFFMVRNLSKNVSHHGWLTTKKFKIALAKTPWNSPKKSRNLDQKISDSKSYIYSLYINFRFSGRKSQNQQKLARKITYFTI